MVFGRWSGFGFQSSSSPIMEGVVDLHNHIFFFLVLVFVFVIWVFGNVLYQFWWRVGSPVVRPELLPLRKASHSTSLEVIWTLIPSFILVAIAVPSFALLYAMDEIMEPALTLKVVGHQWYWTYQYSNCLAGLRYSFADHPEWVPQSLWDRIWFNALFFFENYLVPVDPATPVKSRNYTPPAPPAYDSEFAGKELDRLTSELPWYRLPTRWVAEFTRCNRQSFKGLASMESLDLYEVFARAREYHPEPYKLGWTVDEQLESTERAHRGQFYPVPPKGMMFEQLAAWANYHYGSGKPIPKLWVVGIDPINCPELESEDFRRADFARFQLYGSHMIRTAVDRLSRVNTPTEPQFASDIIWFTEYFNRKLIAGKVAEALGMRVDLSRVAARLPGVQFDSYMLSEEELQASGDYRLLEVDEPVVLPANTQIRLLITADDVIHSFALPQLGIKVDAVPGRLNQQGVFIKREGTFYGQCSELCGVNHGFMPIVVKAVGSWEFMDWYIKKFDSLFPEYGFAMADPEEVRAFIETGAYPAKYADRFNKGTFVEEPITASKVGSIFDQTPTYKTPLFESYHNYFLNRLGLWHSVALETNWGQVQVNPTGAHANSTYPAALRPGESGPIFGRTITYDYWARTKDRPPLVWGESPVYYHISLSRPMEFLDRYIPSETNMFLMAAGQKKPLTLNCTAPMGENVIPPSLREGGYYPVKLKFNSQSEG